HEEIESPRLEPALDDRSGDAVPGILETAAVEARDIARVRLHPVVEREAAERQPVPEIGTGRNDDQGFVATAQAGPDRRLQRRLPSGRFGEPAPEMLPGGQGIDDLRAEEKAADDDGGPTREMAEDEHQDGGIEDVVERPEEAARGAEGA